MVARTAAVALESLQWDLRPDMIIDAKRMPSALPRNWIGPTMTETRMNEDARREEVEVRDAEAGTSRRSFLLGSVALLGSACGGGNAGAGVSSSTPSAQSSQGLQPAWLKGVAIGQWVEIPGSSFARLGPSMTKPPATWSGSDSDIIDAWNGLAVDRRTSTLWSCWNGGHNNIWDNSVNRLTLQANTPVWTRMLAASNVSAVTQTSPRYSDGRPASSHSYTHLHCIEAMNRIVRFGVGAASMQGGFCPDCASYGIDTNQEDAINTIAPMPFQSYETPWSVVSDPSTGNTYLAAYYTIYKWTAATNSWSNIGGLKSMKGFGLNGAVDTNRKRALFVGGTPGGYYSPCTPSVLDLATDKLASVTLGGSQPNVLAFDYGPGIDYVPELDLFLARTPVAGGLVYSIDPATFAIEPWPSLGGAAIPAPKVNVFTRFRYLPNLRGIVYVPTYAANAWFLRTG